MKALLSRAAARYKADRQLRWFVGWCGKWLLLILLLVAWTFAACRYGQKKALAVYEGWMEDYRAEQEALEQAEYEADPYTIQLNAEADALAKVLYGVKDNSSDDLKTYCWCVFNRVDNRNYPDTLAEVIAQPGQWMRYDTKNPILESLYDLAREQLDAWHTGTHRPVSNEYVFMSWRSNDICLRDNFEVNAYTNYWRWGQK